MCSGSMRKVGYVCGIVSVLAILASGCNDSGGGTPSLLSNSFRSAVLVSDTAAGGGAVVDPQLVNPWGIAFSAGRPFWVSDNHSGVSTLYNGAGTKQQLVVTLPGPGGAGTSSPTGVVVGNGSGFNITAGGQTGPALFIFSTEDGVIDAWNGSAGATAVQPVDNSSANAIYKGLAMATLNGASFLYAPDFHNGRVDVFDSSFHQVSGAPLAAGAFVDSAIPAGFAPFNIASLNGRLYVSFAMQDANREDDTPGLGNGFVDVFNTDGTLVTRLISRGPLNSPWGMMIAPAGFTPFAGDLLVGNFGNGVINVFDPTTGRQVGTLTDSTGNPIQIEGLWSLIDGTGAPSAVPGAVYFTAGPAAESHGALGTLTPTVSSR